MVIFHSYVNVYQRVWWIDFGWNNLANDLWMNNVGKDLLRLTPLFCPKIGDPCCRGGSVPSDGWGKYMVLFFISNVYPSISEVSVLGIISLYYIIRIIFIYIYAICHILYAMCYIWLHLYQ